MAVLRAQDSGAEDVRAFGAEGVGAGTDVGGELERVRSNLAALAEVVEEIRAKLNGHAHGGAVVPPPASERALTAYTMH